MATSRRSATRSNAGTAWSRASLSGAGRSRDLVQSRFQGRQAAVGGLRSGRHHQRELHVAVHQGGRVVQLDVHTGLLQQRGVVRAVVAQRVVFGGGHVRGRQAGQGGGGGRG